uniref:Uncharacterized protein n=1 Tax=Pithovirus LCDPAC01 TaxID=2506600 RepID=A0A481YNA1_9VIRU|nr:MAG: hypothetical protein LCDPAC01_02300 [Pithovirus LCDPAC01]
MEQKLSPMWWLRASKKIGYADVYSEISSSFQKYSYERCIDIFIHCLANNDIPYIDDIHVVSAMLSNARCVKGLDCAAYCTVLYWIIHGDEFNTISINNNSGFNTNQTLQDIEFDIKGTRFILIIKRISAVISSLYGMTMDCTPKKMNLWDIMPLLVKFQKLGVLTNMTMDEANEIREICNVISIFIKSLCITGKSKVKYSDKMIPFVNPKSLGDDVNSEYLINYISEIRDIDFLNDYLTLIRERYPKGPAAIMLAEYTKNHIHKLIPTRIKHTLQDKKNPAFRLLGLPIDMIYVSAIPIQTLDKLKKIIMEGIRERVRNLFKQCKDLGLSINNLFTSTVEKWYLYPRTDVVFVIEGTSVYIMTNKEVKNKKNIYTRSVLNIDTSGMCYQNETLEQIWSRNLLVEVKLDPWPAVETVQDLSSMM